MWQVVKKEWTGSKWEVVQIISTVKDAEEGWAEVCTIMEENGQEKPCWGCPQRCYDVIKSNCIIV